MQRKRALAYAIVGMVLLMPYVVLAQVFPLVPCDGVGTPCDACALVTLADRILQFFVYLSVFVAVIAFTWAGFLFVTAAGNESQITKAKSTFSTVAIGLIIVLAAWLIVDTILRFTDRGGLNNWVNLVCAPTAQFDPPTSTSGAGGGGVAGRANGNQTGTGSGADDTKLSHSDAVDQLNNKGISVKTGSGAADLEGLRQGTVDALGTLSDSCNCTFVVTEGTGGSHSTRTEINHANGYKADIRTRDNQRLVNHVRSLPSAGSWSDGTKLYRLSDSIVIADEADHLDLVHLDATPS